MRTYWHEHFEDYKDQVLYAKNVLDIDYEPHQMCVDCVIYHTKVKNLKFNIRCQPLPKDQFDHQPKDTSHLLQLAAHNPYYFAKYILRIEPREFQKQFLSCTQFRKVLRIARRQGKSHAMQMYMLWYQITKPRQKIRIAAPRETHVMELFDKMNDMLLNQPLLKNSVIKAGKADGKLYSRSPNYEFKFTNGSTIRGITTGDTDGTTMRSQSADLLVLDETDYISEEQFAAVYPLIATSSNTELIQQSTPSGRQTYFKSWCFDPQYREMHLRYVDLETYDPKVDEEFKRNMTQDQYDREMNAEFTIQQSGVFPNYLIDAQLEDYEFDIMPPPAGIYTFGIDWNESVQGVHIVILRYEYYHAKFRVSNIVVVEPSEFTQVFQIEKIVELYSYYKPKKIVMDEGYGVTQIQQLKLWALQNKDEEFLNQLTVINFGKQIEVLDPITGTYVNVYPKEYAVQLVKRALEQNKLILPMSQDYKTRLIGQMRDYMVEKVTETGAVKFSKGNVHTLEQLLLAMYGMDLIRDMLQSGGVVQQPKPVMTSVFKGEAIAPTAIRSPKRPTGYWRDIDSIYKQRRWRV